DPFASGGGPSVLWHHVIVLIPLSSLAGLSPPNFATAVAKLLSFRSVSKSFYPHSRFLPLYLDSICLFSAE
ncbi:MAG: hypothetical protein J1E82_09055, partial [Muribaculaceae bacterium]|nr:hypothetical protein [Muribaculaceae bacterium]